MNEMHKIHAADEADEAAPGEALTRFGTLVYKELLRFWKVAHQTVGAPILTALLFLLVFSHAFGDRATIFPNVSYSAFLVPGLVMMSVLQNAFANSSSSLIQSKLTGNIVFMLLPPISYAEFFWAYVLASALRGMVVGAGVLAVTAWFVPLQFESPLWAFAFALLGSALLGALGLVAGIWAEKFDHLAAFQNFLIVPLTFLSGVFYSIHSLPPFWQALSRLNPFFYLIDGFRYGVLRCLGRAPRREPGRPRGKLRAGFGRHAAHAGIWLPAARLTPPTGHSFTRTTSTRAEKTWSQRKASSRESKQGSPASTSKSSVTASIFRRSSWRTRSTVDRASSAINWSTRRSVSACAKRSMRYRCAR